MSASAASWLAEPWAGAFLAVVADPLAGCDWSDEPAELPGWPGAVPVAQALGHPSLRGQLGRWLLPAPAAEPILEACRARPRTRLALLACDEAAWLTARAAAWLDAPRIAGLLQRSEVVQARAALGEDAYAFALGGAALLSRPTPALLDALPDAVDPMRRGAALFGLALGSAPVPLLDRLRLRRPASLWAEVARHAGQDAPEPARDSALGALRRLARERGASWSGWLS